MPLEFLHIKLAHVDLEFAVLCGTLGKRHADFDATKREVIGPWYYVALYNASNCVPWGEVVVAILTSLHVHFSIASTHYCSALFWYSHVN